MDTLLGILKQLGLFIALCAWAYALFYFGYERPRLKDLERRKNTRNAEGLTPAEAHDELVRKLNALYAEDKRKKEQQKPINNKGKL